jgi:single-stranded-DNA-specific exonuclease
MVSYRLLATGDSAEAASLAELLESANEERQRLTRSLQELARQQLGAISPEERLLLVAGPEYRAGVVGLVAGRLAEELYRPAIVMEVGPETSRGSARSIPEFNVVSALDECRDLLVRFGGHAQAAGFTVENRILPVLESRLRAIAIRELGGLALEPTLGIDAELPLNQVTWKSLEWLERLAPFGYANPTPVLVSRAVSMRAAPRIVGRDHLKLRVGDGRGSVAIDAIGFRMGGLLEAAARQPLWDIAYCLESNQWGDRSPSLQLRLKDMRPSTGIR